MTENFAERVSELAFHHRKRGFDVRAHVVVLQELGTPELKVVALKTPFKGQ
jgi:hypothetical protein